MAYSHTTHFGSDCVNPSRRPFRNTLIEAYATVRLVAEGGRDLGALPYAAD